ncbi:unnamed protein product [Effrenium voratum]|uniref:Uncharacterized protein n=1 Tax=Effrenium voratum TaxID=2562239 RepID=A0AA36N7S7_9DINO|nr:unnamed protein product [Effrenium voratum]
MVDDLDASFNLVACALELALPASVQKTHLSASEGHTEEQQEFLNNGGILIDSRSKQMAGFLLGQDPLHVYFRLVEAVDFRSIDSAFLLRCLRKLLRSWNYELEVTGVDQELEHVRAERTHDALPWLAVCSSNHLQEAATLPDILRSYFHGSVIPSNAHAILLRSVAFEWNHPDSGIMLPQCAKAVILDDIGRKTSMAGMSRAEVAKAVHAAVHTGPLTPENICKELGLLHGFAAHRLFEGMTAAGSLEWERAQFQYLKRVRKRPGGLKGSQVTPTRVWDSSKVAGGHNFAKAVQLQQKPLIVRGLMAAHEAKRWCVSQGYNISLGTVGVERFWRNMQRMSRNLARSQGSEETVYLVSVERWLREVQARACAGAGADFHGGAAALAAFRSAGERLANALLAGNDAGTCMQRVDATTPAMRSIYAMYLEGSL